MPMKRLFLSLMALVIAAGAQSQAIADSVDKDPTKGDTAIAASIINNYLGYIDFEHLLKDSVVHVSTSLVEREHPQDTIKILRWYGANRQNRIEIWQNGRMEDAFYSDGKKLYKRFSKSRRAWRNMSQMSYIEITMPFDIRGALHNWRSKGSEAYYVGTYNYNEQPTYRIFVTTPDMFDRNYFFERKTGLLFLVTEEDHIYGNAEKAANAQRVDWRGWHEFTPFRGCLLPTVESYQVEHQLFVMNHSYQMLPYRKAFFTQNVY